MTVKESFNEVLRRLDIVDLAKRLGLSIGKREPRYTTAICPFHDDRTPSLALYNDKDNPHYYCFACGARGGVLDLVDRRRPATRSENLRWLAELAGVDLHFPSPAGASVAGLSRDTFVSWLQANHSQDTLAEFASQRRLDPSVFRTYSAYAVDLNRLVPEELAAADRELFERAGVLTRRRHSLAPVAAGRQIVFPIDEAGFVFRSLDLRTKQRRYRFSKGFRRADTVFGTEIANADIKSGNAEDGLFIVEGLIDVLRLHSLGLTSVGALGTSISRQQAEIIHKLAGADGRRVLPLHLFLDNDEAGAKAIPSALRAFLGRSDPLPIDVIAPPSEGDPDELLSNSSAEEARRLVHSWAHSALAALIHHFTRLPVATASDELLTARPLQRVEALRYLAAQFNGHWPKVREFADPSAVYFHNTSRHDAEWLKSALDRAHGLRPANAIQLPPASLMGPTHTDGPDTALHRAMRIAQSSNFRREYPFDWGGMTRLALAGRTMTLVSRQLLTQRQRKALPYAARLVPKEHGKMRLKAGPWPEDAVLQQYVLSELLRARADTPGWYFEFPAVRLIRSSGPYPTMTGPAWLLPVGRPGASVEVVSFAYQIDQQIVDGDTPPRREGMFVPYRECWQQFIDHLDAYVAAQPIDTDTFYAVRLDISGFFDNLPRFVVDDVLVRALSEATERHFSGLDFASEIAELLKFESGEADDHANRRRADFVARWLTDQSFGYQYFDPANGTVRSGANPTVGIPQGPDLSAFLANLSLFPLDRAVTQTIENHRATQNPSADDAPAPAVYGRYVDDMVVIATSQSLLNRIEIQIGEELRKRGLAMNSKHERTKALTRRKIREWLLGERGAAVLVSAGGEETPTTSRTTIDELLHINPSTTRGQILQLLHHDGLFAPAWASEESGARIVEKTIARFRDLTPEKLRYYDWVSVARWCLHSFINREPTENVAEFSNSLFRWWLELYGSRTIDREFGEDPAEFTKRQDHLSIVPLLILFDAIERLIDSRHDRRTGIDQGTRRALRHSREALSRLVHIDDLCGNLLDIAKRHPAFGKAYWRVATMLEIQRLGVRGLAATICNQEPRVWVSLSSKLPYPVRRFGLNGLGAYIGRHAQPTTAELADSDVAHASPEAESLVALHEALARLSAPEVSGGGDPLGPIALTIELNSQAIAVARGDVRNGDLESAAYILELVNQFLEHPTEGSGAIDAAAVLPAFVEVVAGVPEGHARLEARAHLVEQFAGIGARALAVPPGVDAGAFFVKSEATLNAFAFLKAEETPQPEDLLFGLTASTSGTIGGLARYKCELPTGYTISTPVPARIDPTSVTPSDLRIFARAYRALANNQAHAARSDDQDHQPISPLQILEPTSGEGPWQTFGAVSNLPVGPQAFVRLSDERLHSVALYANGAHLWKVGFTLADNLGYRGFARSSELDRLTVAPLEPGDTIEAIPFYMMQLTVPRLCGALLGRSRFRIDPASKLPGVIEKQLDRLERFRDLDEGPVARLAMLLEAGAEARTAELIKDAPAPLRIAGTLSSVFRAVGRASARPETIFTGNLPPSSSTIHTGRRSADLWFSAATRLSEIEGGGSGLTAAGAAMQVVGLSKITQALSLELWSLMPEEERRRFAHFIPEVSELEIDGEVLLVALGRTKRAPATDDQASRLISTLLDNAVPGATARSALDQVTPLGWVVALATLTGQLSLRRLPSGDHYEISRPSVLPPHTAEDSSDPAELGQSSDLLTALTEVAQYLAQTIDDDLVELVQDSNWPWSAFASLVAGAGRAVSNILKVVRAVDCIYGLRATTRRSRFFQVTEPDERGYCLIDRELDGRVTIAGWQIDRDSLGITRPGDIETVADPTGGRAFVWSETVRLQQP